MTGPVTKEQPSPMVAGKGVIIGITVFFSCLSLTLGFFIGRYGAPRQAAPPAPTVTLDAQQPVAEAPVPAPVQAPAATPQTASQQEDPAKAPAGKAVPETAAKPVQKSPEPVKQAAEPAPVAVPPAPPSPATEPARQAKASPKVHETGQAAHTTEQAKQEKAASRFTVQIGAFRSRAEADRFKTKYSGKGYKIYIHAVKANKTVKIYKVRTGTFTEKKEAEVLALRLKKSEGLHAFVTPAE